MSEMSLNIYFCGSIQGGRDDVHVYGKIVDKLKVYGKVLTEHVARPNIEKTEIPDPKFVHDRDEEWLIQSDIVVAEVTQPSLGVGYELGRAMAMKKPIYCMFRPSSGKKLSAMIRGASNNSNFFVRDYKELEAEKVVTDILQGFQKP